MEAGLKPVVVINKIDRPDRAHRRGAGRDPRPVHRAGRRRRPAGLPGALRLRRPGHRHADRLEEEGKDLQPDLRHRSWSSIPCPEGDPDAPLQAMVTSLDYDEYVGRVAIARVGRARVRAGQQVARGQAGRLAWSGSAAAQLFVFHGLKRVPMEEATVGDIVAMTGLEDVNIGETITDPENPQPLPPIKVDEPTLQMTFRVNDSPVRRAGRQVRHLPPPAGAALQGAGAERRPAGGGDRFTGRLHRSPAAASCTCPSSSRPCAGKGTSWPSPSPRSSSGTTRRATSWSPWSS